MCIKCKFIYFQPSTPPTVPLSLQTLYSKQEYQRQQLERQHVVEKVSILFCTDLWNCTQSYILTLLILSIDHRKLQLLIMKLFGIEGKGSTGHGDAAVAWARQRLRRDECWRTALTELLQPDAWPGQPLQQRAIGGRGKGLDSLSQQQSWPPPLEEGSSRQIWKN